MKNSISIITPTRNAAETIAEALESVRFQQSECHGEIYEHLLIDAASTDRTLELASHFSHLKIVSEPDRGIYDGMNKGAQLAKGEWLLFLQADDWLPEGSLAMYKKAIAANPDADFICGSAEAVKGSSGKWSIIWSISDDIYKKLTVANISLGEPMINARLIRRDAFWRLGGFSLEYSLASDRDFLLRAVNAKLRQVEIDWPTYRYRWHDGSSTMTEGNSMSDRLSRENIQIVTKHLTQADDENRRIYKKWHSHLQVQAAMNALEKPDMKGLLTAVRHGSTSDPIWFFRFISEVASSLPGFLSRGGKTRSSLLRMKNSP